MNKNEITIEHNTFTGLTKYQLDPIKSAFSSDSKGNILFSYNPIVNHAGEYDHFNYSKAGDGGFVEWITRKELFLPVVPISMLVADLYIYYHFMKNVRCMEGKI